MKSKTQFAKTFQKFVCEQILPSIRKRRRFELEQQLSQKESQLQEERKYRLGLQESLLNNREPIEATQIIANNKKIVAKYRNKIVCGCGQVKFFKTIMEQMVSCGI